MYTITKYFYFQKTRILYQLRFYFKKFTAIANILTAKDLKLPKIYS